MKKIFTSKSNCRRSAAVKAVMTGCNLFACPVIALIMLFAAWHVQAADTNSGNAKQAVGNAVWFGNYPQAYYGWPPQNTPPATPYVLKDNHRERDGQNPPQMRPCFFLVQPLKWRVLDVDAQGILLVTDENIDAQPYHNALGSTSWSGSSIRAWLESDFLLGGTSLPTATDYFSGVERSAVVVSALSNPSTPSDADGIMTNDRVFLLSANEAETLFADDNARKGLNSEYAASYENTSNPQVVDVWLTRSHSESLFEGFAAYVQEDGAVNREDGLKNVLPFQIRPALRLSRSAIVMVSDAAGKPAYTGGTLATTEVPAGSLLKLTLTDASLTLTSSNGKYPLVNPSGTISLNYDNASTAAGRHISCTLEELDGNMLYYAKLTAANPPASGTVSISIPPAVGEGSYTLKLFCEEPNADPKTPDRASLPVVFNLGVSSSAVAPAITTATLPNGMTGLAYDETLTATGTPAPVWELVSGTIPPGLTLEPGGQLHGTPSAAGTYAFTLSATNGMGSNSHAYSVNITASSAPVITSPAAGILTGQVRGVTYDPVTIVATGVPAPTFSVIAGSLPLGISLDPVTGVISGTPTKEVNATFTVEARNFAGVSTRDYSINIAPTGTPEAPAFVTDPAVPLPTAHAGKPYSFQFVVTGVPAPDVTTSTPLPAGLFLSPSGLLSGTPLLSAAGTTYTIPVDLASTAGTAAASFQLSINFLLNRPTLTLTPPVTTTSNPFTVTATFERPVSGLLAADIAVSGGTAASVTMTNPSGTPVRASIWSFEVTPDPDNLDGTTLRAWIRANAALDEYGARTVSESDTVSVIYRASRPVGDFSFAEGEVFVSDPGGFSFTVTPYGTSSGLFVGSAPASDANIGEAIEISREGNPVEGWNASVSGSTITVDGVFGAGNYTVTVKGGVIRNDLGNYLNQKTGHFVVQTSKVWYEGCPQALALNFAASANNRQLTIEYRGLAASCLVAHDGTSAPVALTVAAGETEKEILLRSLHVPEAQEGGTGEIEIRLDGVLHTLLSGLHFYNRLTTDDVIYFSPTTMFSGYLALVRNGSPYLQRSLNGGVTWHNAWTPTPPGELANQDEALRFREPDGCYELIIPIGADPAINYSIPRSISLPVVPDLVTSPAGGGYSVHSGEDFVFRLTPGARYAGMTPEVSTGRTSVPDSIGVVVTPGDDGSFEVRIRVVRESLHISIRMTNAASSGNEDAGTPTTRVWTGGGQLYILAARSGEAKVYTFTGTLLRSISVEAGQISRSSLPAGFHIVAFDDGSRFKVSGF
ncbi:MAG: putative Ig domain-containing protein [Tannerella sp.]|jgi:hypothetical protein|nr:putative Ig domain-containing protein [Tannerella sp.]